MKERVSGNFAEFLRKNSRKQVNEGKSTNLRKGHDRNLKSHQKKVAETKRQNEQQEVPNRKWKNKRVESETCAESNQVRPVKEPIISVIASFRLLNSQGSGFSPDVTACPPPWATDQDAARSRGATKLQSPRKDARPSDNTSESVSSLDVEVTWRSRRILDEFQVRRAAFFFWFRERQKSRCANTALCSCNYRVQIDEICCETAAEREVQPGEQDLPCLIIALPVPPLFSTATFTEHAFPEKLTACHGDWCSVSANALKPILECRGHEVTRLFCALVAFAIRPLK